MKKENPQGQIFFKKKQLGFSHQASKKTLKLDCLGKNADSKNVEVWRLIFKSKGIDLTWNTYKSKVNLKNSVHNSLS